MWKMIECDICNRDIASSGWENHLRMHKRDKPCASCGKIVSGRKKFCNCSCASKFNKNRQGAGKPLGLCKCGKPLIERHSRFCSKECWAKNEYDFYIKEWLEGKVSGGQKKGSGIVSSHVRRWLFERAENKCEAILDNGLRCGWSRVNLKTGKVPLTVHHRDGNAERHVPENLELICPCCHSITPTYGALNKGNGRKNRKN